MPIILDDIINKKTKTKVKYTPKYFNSKLTGSGKKSGCINEALNPINHIDDDLKHIVLSKAKRTIKNGSTTTYYIPIKLTLPATPNRLTLNPDATLLPITNANIYINVELVQIDLVEQQLYTRNDKTVKTVYQVDIYFKQDINNDTYSYSKTNVPPHILSLNDNYVFSLTTNNPYRVLIEELIPIINTLSPQNDIEEFITDYIENISVYEQLLNQSEIWQTNNIAKQYIDNINTLINNTDHHFESILIESINNLSTHMITLNAYTEIYDFLKQTFPPDQLNNIVKHNLNLLLMNTMANLKANKSLLHTTPSGTTTATHLSKEQIKAIETTDPLILVQAGAGTGKSTTILNRVNYMVANGINPQDIMVLSFTNAAADNITAKNPEVNSMTIAKMIHTIYSDNFKTHDISTLETMINTIDIYYKPQNLSQDKYNFILTFKQHLRAINANNQHSSAVVQLNNFIEDNYDAVIDVLNDIRQTTLDLEILICYQNIGIFNIPAEIKTKHIIVDEVQDNSIFEFVYILKYVNYHKDSLFIVGDSSQTLYEFRAANPKALNILEGSNVFTTFKLNTNYRSNQEILDFANILLNNIDANQYANIQLKSNTITPITAKSFTDKVKLSYTKLNKQSEYKEILPVVFHVNTMDYIQEKLANNEQIAILAHARMDIDIVEKVIKNQYPNANLVNLIPTKNHNLTYFSKFIGLYWDSLRASTANIIVSIQHIMLSNISNLTKNPRYEEDKLKKMLATWIKENQSTIQGWEQAAKNQIITYDQLYDNVKESMLNFEIKNNHIRQNLLHARNQTNKDNDAIKNADIIFSTIHSAKGLEFDNTIVIYHTRQDLAEDKKRMYYVALTRAMKSEFILAFDTEPNPTIQLDYQTIVKRLNAFTTNPADKIRGIHDSYGQAIVLDNEVEDDNLIDLDINLKIDLDIDYNED